MYNVEKFYNDLPFKSKLLDFYLQNNANKKIACLDIETTGLSPKNSKFILGALLEFQENGYLLKQYFAESLSEEKDILIRYMNEIQNVDILITYNGKNFDLKYLQSKLSEYGIFENYRFPLNIDIYLLIHGFSKLRNFLPNLKQKTVENYMGIWDKRTDLISGADSIKRYYTYLTSKDTAIRDEILLHNSDDVLQLARLLPVLLKIDLSSGFLKLPCPFSFAISEHIKLSGKSIVISGISTSPFSYYAYNIDDQPCTLEIDKNSKRFHFELPTIRKSNMHILNLKNIVADFSPLGENENYANGYLLLKRGDTIYGKSIIHTMQIIFNRIEKLLIP